MQPQLTLDTHRIGNLAVAEFTLQNTGTLEFILHYVQTAHPDIVSVECLQYDTDPPPPSFVSTRAPWVLIRNDLRTVAQLCMNSSNTYTAPLASGQVIGNDGGRSPEHLGC
eukprot:TRINITY_DN5008_c0_g1_i1.p1 TRINITY_DN5008_c0_g1~~TRINITY_DN5008_c0_g1_i1.p1  ORF type:complete len:121 (-),score=11.83 TRINITY_DN5008_c0_g1_i1:131-463(-)